MMEMDQTGVLDVHSMESVWRMFMDGGSHTDFPWRMDHGSMDDESTMDNGYY
jgi:hypothetical protein